MKRRTIVGISILAVLIGAGVVYSLASKPKEQSTASTPVEQSTTQPQAQETPAPQNQAQAATPGSYTQYSSQALAAADGTRILFFHASWCPQCRQLDASIKAGTVPDGVTIFKVDYDSNQALRQKYGVTIQTTLVKIDKDGKLVKKYVAYDDPTLTSVKSNLLP